MRKVLLFLFCFIVTVSFTGCNYNNSESEDDFINTETTENININNEIESQTTDSKISETEEAIETTEKDDLNSVLPIGAKEAVSAYINCKSYDALLDIILPTAAANESRAGNPLVGDYSFGFMGATCEDEQVLECSAMSQEQAAKIGAFWATGLSLQGISADFTVCEGFDVLVSAVCSIEDEFDIEEHKIKVTRRLAVLNVENDRWIIIPSADEESTKWEFV